MKEVSSALKPYDLLYTVMPNRFSMINLLSDPQYSVPGACLVPRWMAEWYVVKLPRLTDGYWTEKYFSYNEVIQLFCSFEFDWKELRRRYKEIEQLKSLRFKAGNGWLGHFDSPACAEWLWHGRREIHSPRFSAWLGFCGCQVRPDYGDWCKFQRNAFIRASGPLAL